MFFILKILAKTLAALNSNGKPASIGAALCMAFLLAIIPAGNLLWISILLLSFLFRVHWGMELLFFLIFKGLSPLLTSWTEPLGWALMQKPAITALIYRINAVPFLFMADLNHSLTFGGLAAGIFAWLPLFFLTLFLVKLFREKISPAIARSKWMKAFQKSPLVATFSKALKQFSGMYH